MLLGSLRRTQEKDDSRRAPHAVQVQPSFSASWIGSPREREGIPATALSPPELFSPDRHICLRDRAHYAGRCSDPGKKPNSHFWRLQEIFVSIFGLSGAVPGIIDSFREIGKQGTVSIAAGTGSVRPARRHGGGSLCGGSPGAWIAYNYISLKFRKSAFKGRKPSTPRGEHRTGPA